MNSMTRIKKFIRTDQWIAFIFICKLFKTAELREKINVIEDLRPPELLTYIQ